MNRKFVRETRVGALILVALVILIIGIFSVGQQQKIFGEKVLYKIFFPSINGLHTGDAVMLSGVNVGYVDKIQFPEQLDNPNIEVIVLVQKEIQERIRQDSKARIGSLSLVTTRFLSISMGNISSPLLAPGSYIQAEKTIGYEEVLNSSDAVINNIGGIAHDLHNILANISEGKGLLGSLITEPGPEFMQTIKNLQRTTTQLESLVIDVQNGKGALGIMMQDTVVVRETVHNLQQASQRLNRVTEKLEQSQTLMGRAINDKEYGKEVTKNLSDILLSLKNITAKIDTGKGTIGAMVNDPEVYWALRDAIYGVESNRFLKWFLPKTREQGESVRKGMKKRQ